MKKMIEIPDFAGYYVSADGKIYTTLKQGCRNRYDLSKRTAPVELKVRKTKTGYCRVYMRRESSDTREDVYVHRIVANVFIPNPNHCSDINHKDCDVANNAVSNLEWMTHKDNLEYGFVYGNKARDILGRFCSK